MRNLNDPREIVCERAGLEDLRTHDARHSYALRALALVESLPMICCGKPAPPSCAANPPPDERT